MAPPPGNAGDEFPDFDSMTPEEQMAWLESLARRQGVSEDELTTAADFDIPIPENVEIDEPGYVPFSIREAGSFGPEEPTPPLEIEAEGAAAEGESAAEAGDWAIGDEEALTAVADQVERDIEEVSESAGQAGDAMPWLESLAAQAEQPAVSADVRSEYEAIEPEAEAPVDRSEVWDHGAGEAAAEREVPALEFQAEEEALLVEEAAGEGFSDTAEPVSASEEDVLGGIDPMLWLESLAARQGAKPEELITSADLTIDEVPESAVIDEPGYVPFEGSRSARESAFGEQATEIGLVAESGPPLDLEPIEGGEPSEPAGLMPADDLLAEFEPASEQMGPVESLAPPDTEEGLFAGEGDRLEEEVFASADLPISELAAEAPVEESRFVDYVAPEGRPERELEALEAMPVEGQTAAPDAEQEAFAEAVEEAEPGSGVADALAWLDDLAGEPTEDLAEFLVLEDVLQPDIETEAEMHADLAADPLAGMTDDEIDRALASGQLTGQQELAWLKRQAARLAEQRAAEKAGLGVPQTGELEPAQPAELPDWLRDMQPETIETPAEAGVAGLEPAGDAEELAGWLEEVVSADELELAGLVPDTGAELLWADTSDEELALAEQSLPESELEAFLEGGLAELDSLAEALDEEFERSLTGDVAEPAWYSEALSRAAAEASEQYDDSALSQAVPVEMPAWLMEPGDDLPPTESEMPSWLAEEAPRSADMGPAEGDWLRELDRHEMAELPEAAPVVPRAPLMPVSDEEFETYQRRFEDNPDDWPNRLALARALRARHEVAPSLDHYEALLDAFDVLPEVQADLADMVADHPHVPRVRRLLGDAYLRRGMLQAALDAYRGALDQL